MLALAACAGRGAGSTTPPVGPPLVRPIELPSVPRVVGRLEPRVVYPPAGALIAAPDSNFVLGSVGSGDALLSINEARVPVLPNGSFLAFLAMPPREQPVYDIVVVRGADTVRLRHPITRPRAPVPLATGGPQLADAASLAPTGLHLRLPGEAIRLSIRAAPDTRVDLVAAVGARVTLPPAIGDSILREADVPVELLADGAMIVATRGSDSLRVSAPRAAVVAAGALAMVGVAPSTLPDTDRVVIGRPVRGGTYKWFLLPGTVVEVTGQSNDAVRVRLDRDLHVWVDSTEIGLLPAGSARPLRVVGNGRVVVGPTGEWTDVVLPLAAPAPYAVEPTADGLELTLHGVTANTDIINYATADSLVARITWEQERTDRARYRVSLRETLAGYLVLWRPGALVLRLRRMPRVDAARPLAGLTIAVDAGHPPAGSTGPTGLYEAVATLAISERLRALLEQRGARVVMTRTGPGALGLAERPLAARRANAHAFASIHLNALPDGVNPFRAHGTGTYYFTPHSVALARAVQRGMIARLGLRDLGINYDNLAVIRPTWMPAILCEGAFLIIPEQEAALRDPAFQEAYALGVADGLEAFFGRFGRR